MKASQLSEVTFYLKKMVCEYPQVLLYHQWPSEHDRWIELIFALVARATRKPEAEVRRAVHRLDALGLLAVDDLAEMRMTDAGIDWDAHLARRIKEVLRERPAGEKEAGREISEEEARRSIQVMHEAAQGLMSRHGGKIQKYLRSYGERMLDELPEHFAFSGLAEADVRHAFAYWLQNVLSMPVVLDAAALREFCEQKGTSVEDLVKQADALDLNIAVLDDLVDQHASSSGKRQHGRPRKRGERATA